MVPCAPSSIIDIIPSDSSSNSTTTNSAISNSTSIISSQDDIETIQSRNALIIGPILYLLANLVEWITCKNGLIGSLLSTIGASLFIAAFASVTSSQDGFFKVVSVVVDGNGSSMNEDDSDLASNGSGGANWEFFIGGIFLFVKYSIDLIFNYKAKRLVSATSYVLAVLSSFLFVIVGLVGFAAYGNDNGNDGDSGDNGNATNAYYFRGFCNLIFSSAFVYCLSAIMYGAGQFVDSPVESWIDEGI